VDDEVDESFAVAAAAERLHNKGAKLGDIAVFYRTNSQSRVLEDGMRRRGLPYRIVGGTRFYDRREVKDLLAWLKLLINPRDRGSIERIANIPRRGVGEKTLEALFQLAEDETIGALDILEEDRWLERVAVGRNATPLRDFARAWRLVRRLPRSSPAACVEGVIAMVGLEEHYRATEEPGDAPDRIANVKEVITAAEQYHEVNPDGGLAGFLDQVALVTDADDQERRAKGADQITLMTLHMAKGLEFPVVFITGCEDGVLPLRRQGVTADLEEERRLMYVGITRAMHLLHLSHARTRHQYGQSFRQQPSQFLSEIPADCYLGGRAGANAAGVAAAEGPGLPGNRHGARGRGPDHDQGDDLGDEGRRPNRPATAARGERAPERPAGPRPSLAEITRLAGLRRGSDLRPAGGPATASAAEPGAAGPDDPYAVGARVVHHDFGYGTVAGYTGRPDRRNVVVAFDDGRQRELQLAFTRARLAAAP
jgi:DNA helicase-2/ATP-dependent DNA helicase PcrA